MTNALLRAKSVSCIWVCQRPYMNPASDCVYFIRFTTSVQ